MKILIVDKWPVIQLGLRTLLKRKYPKAEIYLSNDPESTPIITEGHPFDLLLLGESRSYGQELRFIKKVKSEYPSTKIIVFLESSDNELAGVLYSAKADGILLKKADSDDILKAIDTVLANRIHIDMMILTDILESMKLYSRLKPGKTKQTALSARQSQIATLLINGKSTSLIANMLNLANTTVSTHKFQIFRKSGVTNVIDLKKRLYRASHTMISIEK
jgi:DNA-binding NarL/FixJ family response regulator